uniref:Carbonic anhydrase 1 n=1 Tax=Ursus americanus TaxID=9643 RepID=A0A452R7I3_URSAM
MPFAFYSIGFFTFTKMFHWNSAKYSSFAEAISQADGLAIIGVLMKNKRAPFTNFDPSALLPSSLDYWTYSGSLTHPPLHESVTWIICKEKIGISPQQLAQFRSLLSTVEGDKAVPMQRNNRPPQPLNDRIVRASF